MRTAGRGLALSMALVMGAAACGDGDGGDPSPRETTSSTSTTQARQAEEAEKQAVIDAYLAAVDAFYAAANPPDPDHPGLAATHTGDLLASVKRSLSDMRSRGTAIRRSPRTTYDPVVVSVTEDSAFVEDCGTDADVEFVTKTGEVVDDSVVVGRSTARLVRRSGRWITAAVEFQEQEEPCDVEPS